MLTNRAAAGSVSFRSTGDRGLGLMTHEAPMLADFAVRLAFGLATLLVLTSWRSVPLAFFRTNCQVALGLLVLAALDASREAGSAPARASWSQPPC